MSAKAPLAVFRCDASPTIGAGHVSRCLAFAEALVETGWRVAFAVGRDTVATMPAIASGDFTVHDLDGDAKTEPTVLRELIPGGADLLVVDHYERDISFEGACRGWARRILAMDDGTGREHDCDILVDAGRRDPSVYNGRAGGNARLMLGPMYALIRRKFVASRPAALLRRASLSVENILLSFGATDPWNATPAALAALGRLVRDFDITVAMSSGAPNVADVQRSICGKTRLELDADMAELMTRADLAVGAAGASAFERAVLGLPSILLTLAENQRGIAKLLSDAGAAVDVAGAYDDALSRLPQLVEALIGDPAARSRMSNAAAALVDGRGGYRLLMAAAGEIRTRGGSTVRLRSVEANDENWLLELQRAPQTRRYFRNPAVPSAQEHACWMKGTIADPGVLLAIVEADGDNAGFVRLDRKMIDSINGGREISIAINPQLYGRGIGSAALLLARRLVPASILEAEILPDNAASKALFANAGFRQLDATRYRWSPS
jgi:UDP-2,4-diacetamido-2,4,6-trideoxy-beta-L-altropyranose hydrolase